MKSIKKQQKHLQQLNDCLLVCEIENRMGPMRIYLSRTKYKNKRKNPILIRNEMLICNFKIRFEWDIVLVKF